MTATQSTAKKTIHLQFIGELPAIPSEEVRPGMLVSWNSAYQEYEVVSIERVSKCFFEMVEKDIRTGKEWTRRVKAGRLIAAEWPKEKKIAAAPMPAPENGIRVSTYFIDHCREGSTNLGDRVKTEIVGTYQQAVDAAHEIWKGMEKKTLVTVHSDSFCLYFWHWIGATGEVKDRNSRTGATWPAGYAVKYERNAYRAA